MKPSSIKNFEILSGLPPYGPMYIPISTDSYEAPSYSEGFVVKFKQSTGEEWVANFKRGETSYDNVFGFPEYNLVVVFAGGNGYIMNPDIQKPIKIFGHLISEVIQKDDGSLICCDTRCIIIYKPEKNELWKSHEISWDGIRNLVLQGNKLCGQSFDPFDSTWSNWELDIETKEFSTRNSTKDFQKGNKHQINSTEDKKPWWKFW